MDRIAPRKLTAGEFSRELAAYADALRRQIEMEVEGFPADRTASRKRTERARRDFQFFSETYLPHYFAFGPSRLHQWLYERLPQAIDAPKGTRIAVAAPRGEGKSTIVSLALVLWATLTRRKRYVLLISDVYPQAATLLAAVKAELEANPRLRADFPRATGIGRPWRETVMVTGDNRKLQALGSGQRIRGLRHGPHRPDLVIGDDLENDTFVATPEQRGKLGRWWRGAVRYVGPPDGSLDLIVIGTKLHYDSLLSNLIDSPLWAGRIFRSILRWPDRMDLWDAFAARAQSHGEAAARNYYAARRADMDMGADVSWPEARPLVDLMLEHAEDPTDFAREKQNDPSAGPDAVFAGSISYWSEPPAQALATFGAVDPSLGRAGAGRDPSAILVGALDGDGTLYVLEALIRRRPPDQIIQDVIGLQRRYHCRLWSVEATQFQEFFRSELVKQSAQAGVPVPALGVMPHTDKRLRIESLQPHVANKLIQLHREQTTLIGQLEHFPHAAHDDGPDALHMLWALAVTRGRWAGAGAIRSAPRPDRAPIHWEAY